MPSMEAAVTDEPGTDELEDAKYDIGMIHLATTDDVEEIKESPKSSEPETVENVKGQIVFGLDDFSDDKRFETRQVAVLCGIQPQDVRNYLLAWDPVLKVNKNANGRSMWTKENVLKLQEMLLVKKENNLTMKGVVDYYLSSEDNTPNPGTQIVDPSTLEAISNIINSKIESFIAEKTENLAAQNKSIIDTIAENKKENSENLTKMQEKTDESLAKILESLAELKANEEARSKEIEALRAENKELKDKIDQSKTKKIFGIPIRT